MARTYAQELRIARRQMEKAREWEAQTRGLVNVAHLAGATDTEKDPLYEQWGYALRTVEDCRQWILHLHRMKEFSDKEKDARARRAAARAAVASVAQMGDK